MQGVQAVLWGVCIEIRELGSGWGNRFGSDPGSDPGTRTGLGDINRVWNPNSLHFILPLLSLPPLFLSLFSQAAPAPGWRFRRNFIPSGVISGGWRGGRWPKAAAPPRRNIQIFLFMIFLVVPEWNSLLYSILALKLSNPNLKNLDLQQQKKNKKVTFVSLKGACVCSSVCTVCVWPWLLVCARLWLCMCGLWPRFRCAAVLVLCVRSRPYCVVVCDCDFWFCFFPLLCVVVQVFIGGVETLGFGEWVRKSAAWGRRISKFVAGLGWKKNKNTYWICRLRWEGNTLLDRIVFLEPGLTFGFLLNKWKRNNGKKE